MNFCRKSKINRDESYDVIYGDASIALEMQQQIPDLDAVMVSICGGGLAASMVLANPKCKLIVVEPEGKELDKSLKAKKRLWKEKSFLDTIAESLRLREVGEIPFESCVPIRI